MSSSTRSLFFLLAIIFLLPCIDQGPSRSLQSVPIRPQHDVRHRLILNRLRLRFLELYNGFDPFRFHEGFAENFDVGAARPDESITCWGRYQDGFINHQSRELMQDYLHTINGDNIEHVTAQHVCAKPQYGGSRRLHIGGWCRQGPGEAQVVFDPAIAAQPNRELDSLQTKRWCLQQCYCDDPRVPLARPPKIKNYRAWNHRRDDTYFLTGFLTPPIPPALPPRGGSDQLGLSVAIVNQRQAVNPDFPAVWTTQYVSTSPSKMIFCPGSDLPTWLPPPWGLRDFSSTQSFCAAVFNGGNV